MSTTFWVTTNCNLSCKYCYEDNNKQKIELKDLSINVRHEYDSCKINYNKYGALRSYDCMYDCRKGHPANASIAY